MNGFMPRIRTNAVHPEISSQNPVTSSQNNVKPIKTISYMNRVFQFFITNRVTGYIP